MAPGVCIAILSLWMLGASLAQQDYNEGDQLGYKCAPGSLPCQAYAAFRTGGIYNTIVSAALLFGLSGQQVADSSKLAVGSSISPGQLLLVPLNCSCVSGRSQYNTTYLIQRGDTMYFVSNNTFHGLTTYQAVERANPAVVPTEMNPGDHIIFPIRCACPSTNQTNFKSLLTYGVETGNALGSIARAWNVSVADIVSANRASDLAANLHEFTTLLLPMTEDPPVLPTQDVPATPSAPPPTSPTSTTPPGDGSNGLSTGAIVGIAVGSALAAAGFIALAGFMVFYLVKKRSRLHNDEMAKTKTYSAASTQNNLYSNSFDSSSSTLRKEAAKSNKELVDGMAGLGSDKPIVFSYAEIQDATDNFSPSHLVQGSVYRGMLRNQLVAIKEIKGGTTSQELRILAKVHHSNLVRMVGVCTEEDQFFLVYEYAENGSLSSCLHGKVPLKKPRTESDSAASTSAFLSWNARLQIALDVASGLEYIHDYTKPSFVHKDIKSSNILLDFDLRAKIGNFGMARLTEGTDGSSLPPALTKHISGTQGYMAPEYLTHGFVTTKVDVYAFGVVMLELMTGRKAMLNDETNTQQRFLTQVFIDMLENDDDRETNLVKLKQWIDPTLENAVPWDTFYSFALLARSCTDDDPDARPDMKHITYALSKMLETSLEWETETVLERRYKSAEMEGR